MARAVDHESGEPVRAQAPASLVFASEVAARWIVIVLAAWILLLVVGRLRPVLVPLYGAALLAAALSKPVTLLVRRGWRPLAATFVVYLAFAVVLAALGFWLIPQLVSEAKGFGPAISRGIDRVQHWLVNGPLGLSEDQVRRYRTDVGNQLSDPQGRLVQGVIGGAALAAEIVVGIFFAIALSFFFVKDGSIAFNRLLSRFAADTRVRLRTIGVQSWRVFSSYVQASAVNGLVNAVVFAIGLAILGVPLIVPLAVLTFFAAFFPLIGAIVVGLLAALIALADQGLGTALIVVGLTALVHNLEGYVVGPYVLGRAAHLRPVTVLLAQAIGGVLGGTFGLLVAVPVVAVLINLLGPHPAHADIAARE